MRKNNDGYVLPFVLVVMIVLCIMSASLMTAAFRNLQMQQKFTDRMVDKYAAQGEIEKIVAELTQKRDVVGDSESLTPQELSDFLEDVIGEIHQTEEITIEIDDEIKAGEQFNCTVLIKAFSESTTVQCQLVLLAKYEPVAGENPAKYTITMVDPVYQSYEISTGGGT